MTLDEAAAHFNVTRSRVWQIEQDALRKLRRAIEQEAAASGLSVRELLAEWTSPE